MDIFLLTISFIIMIVGIIGSVIPVLPGPLSSWLGLFIFSNISKVEVSNNLLFITLIVALIIFILDYILPIYTSKKFGASKYGIIGASVGTVIGLFFPPLGIVFGSIIGAISGEMLLNKNIKKSINAATGVFLGLLVSGFTKALISLVFFVVYINLFLNNFGNIF